jgi:uncharacterized protein YllA (UPF0747 family)
VKLALTSSRAQDIVLAGPRPTPGVRFSRLCKRCYSERKEYSNDMKRFYSLRSAIVHGNEAEKKLWNKVNIQDVGEKLRESIKAYIKKINEENKDHDSIIKLIDFGK